MPRQRLVCSDTDPQCTNDSLHHSDTYNSDSDSGSPSHRNIGLTKSCSSSEESSDSPLPTNRTGGQEAFTEESFAGGVEGTERSKEPSRRVEDSLLQYHVQTGPNYSYQVQVDGNGRLRRLSEVGEDGRERRLSLRSLDYKNDADPDSPFSDTDEDEPTTLREYRGHGVSADGEKNGAGYGSPPSLQVHNTRSDQARRGEYKTDKKQDEGGKGYIERGKHSHYGEHDDSYSSFWTELRADME